MRKQLAGLIAVFLFITTAGDYFGTVMTSYAMTLPEKCRITFHSNNGMDDTVVQSVDKGTEVQLDNNRFTYAGHTFICWNTRPDGSGNSYYNRQTVKLTTDLSLYARWQDNALLGMRSDPATVAISGESASNETTDKDKTFNRVMLYFLNSSDLESKSEFGMANLLDLLRADIPENTKIIITTGGTLTWHMNDRESFRKYVKDLLYRDVYEEDLTQKQKDEINAKAREYFDLYSVAIGRKTQIFEVTRGEKGQNKMVYLDSSDKYMLDKTYLTDFINYVTDRYKADKYDLILSDHGGGIDGFGTDEIYRDDLAKHKTPERPDVNLSINNIRGAIENSVYYQNGNKLDFFGIDACKMGTVEVVVAFKNLADYLIMSQDNTPGSGWNYSAVLSALSENPDMSTVELGTTIVNSFAKKYEKMSNINPTISLIDTAKLDAVSDALSGFSTELSRELAIDTKNYLAVVYTVGKESDYSTRSGVNTSGLLDLVKLCNRFAQDKDEVFSDSLKRASQNLIDAVRDAVIIAGGKKEDNGDNGLTVNYPVLPYLRMKSVIDEQGKQKYEYIYNGEAVIQRFREIGVNPDYQKLYADLALRCVIAHIIGENWSKGEADFNKDTVIATLTDAEDIYHTKALLAASGADLKNPEDPLYKIIDSMYDNSVRKNKISVDKTQRNNKQQADVSLRDSDPQLVDEYITVKVSIDTGEYGPNKVALGSLPATWAPGQEDEPNNSISWTVDPFDQKWFTLNNQITSVQILDYDEKSGEYTGYIPLAMWCTLKDVKGDGGKTRKEYLTDMAEAGNLRNIRLNMTVSLNHDTGSITGYSFTGYNDVEDGGNIAATYDMKDFYSSFYELLGGVTDTMLGGLTDEGIYPIGTIYAQQNDLKLDLKTVTDLHNSYNITDAFGNEYELSTANLGAEGLEDYRTDDPLSYDLSYINSQEEAKTIRQLADDMSKPVNGDTDVPDNAADRSLSMPEKSIEPAVTVESGPEKIVEEPVESITEEPSETFTEEPVEEITEEITEEPTEMPTEDTTEDHSEDNSET